MNIYDTVNKLAQEIKESEEYINYKMAKQALDLNSELKINIKEFEKKRYNVQIKVVQTGKRSEEEEKEVERLYLELVENEEARKYFEAETKFNIIIADVNKIIGDAIKDVIK